jgi:hypothetical protein
MLALWALYSIELSEGKGKKQNIFEINLSCTDLIASSFCQSAVYQTWHTAL